MSRRGHHHFRARRVHDDCASGRSSLHRRCSIGTVALWMACAAAGSRAGALASIEDLGRTATAVGNTDTRGLARRGAMGAERRGTVRRCLCRRGRTPGGGPVSVVDVAVCPGSSRGAAESTGNGEPFVLAPGRDRPRESMLRGGEATNSRTHTGLCAYPQAAP